MSEIIINGYSKEFIELVGQDTINEINQALAELEAENELHTQ